MPLPQYIPPTKAISIPGSADALVVRGLTFEDITSLVQTHLPEVIEAVERYRDARGEVYSTRGLDAFLTILLQATPGLVSVAIATAAGDPDAVEQVRVYPVGVQIAALVGVADLTLNDMGSLEDPSPALANLLRQATGTYGARVRSLLDTSGAPDAPSPVSPVPDV